jgi:TetR/AcrR family transcriptional repressor of nem operon
MAGRPRLFDDDAAVDAAMDVFWRKGYASTTPQELASACNMAKGSLYNAFKSKANLFALTLTRYNDRKIEALTTALAAPAPAPECLLAATSSLAGVGTHRNGCFATNSAVELAGVEGEMAAVPERLFTQIEHAFAECILRGQRSGDIADDHDPTRCAAVLLATVIGVSVLARSGRDPQLLTGLLADAVSALTRPSP